MSVLAQCNAEMIRILTPEITRSLRKMGAIKSVPKVRRVEKVVKPEPQLSPEDGMTEIHPLRVQLFFKMIIEAPEDKLLTPEQFNRCFESNS